MTRKRKAWPPGGRRPSLTSRGDVAAVTVYCDGRAKAVHERWEVTSFVARAWSNEARDWLDLPRNMFEEYADRLEWVAAPRNGHYSPTSTHLMHIADTSAQDLLGDRPATSEELNPTTPAPVQAFLDSTTPPDPRDPAYQDYNNKVQELWKRHPFPPSATEMPEYRTRIRLHCKKCNLGKTQKAVPSRELTAAFRAGLTDIPLRAIV